MLLQVTDDTRIKLKRGMDILEQLTLNRFFLVSVLSTMEGQKKFFLKEKYALFTILLYTLKYFQGYIANRFCLVLNGLFLSFEHNLTHVLEKGMCCVQDQGLWLKS